MHLHVLCCVGFMPCLWSCRLLLRLRYGVADLLVGHRAALCGFTGALSCCGGRLCACLSVVCPVRLRFIHSFIHTGSISRRCGLTQRAAEAAAIKFMRWLMMMTLLHA